MIIRVARRSGDGDPVVTTPVHETTRSEHNVHFDC